MVPFSCVGILLSFFFSLLFQDQQIYYNGNNFCAFDASPDLKKDLRSLWNSEPKTWFHFLLVFCCHFFFSLLFQDQQIYYNGNNFCAFDASFDPKKDLRSLWNSEPQTWFHFLLVFCCHSFFFYYSKINKFITTAITFAHLTLAPIWKKIWEACEILNLKHGSIFCWYSVVIFFFLYYSKINKFITTAITFAHLTLASIRKKIWEACEILNLKHGSIFCWYSVVIFFFLYYSKINKFITTAITFAHLTLASIWKKIWEACEILNLKHGSIFCWYSVVIFFFSLLFQDQQIYYKGNNFCAIDASPDPKKDLRSLWNSELKHGSIFCWYSVVILFFSLLFQDQQIYYNGNNFCAFDASFDLKKDLRSLWNSEPKIWFHFLLVFCCHFFFFSIIPRSTNLLQRQ